MKHHIVALTALVLLSFANCVPKVDLEAERAALLQTDCDWAAVAKAGQLERLWSFWSEDAIIYIQGGSAVRGLSEIQAFIRRNRSQPGFSISWEPEGAVVAASGDLGYTFGLGQRTVTIHRIQYLSGP